MRVVKINAISVGEGRGEELEKRFASRAGEVEKMPGFLGFQLLRPTAGEERYFVITEWEDEASFQGWVTSESFNKGHARPAGPGGPVATHSNLLEFEVALAVGKHA